MKATLLVEVNLNNNLSCFYRVCAMPGELGWGWGGGGGGLSKSRGKAALSARAELWYSVARCVRAQSYQSPIPTRLKRRLHTFSRYEALPPSHAQFRSVPFTNVEHRRCQPSQDRRTGNCCCGKSFWFWFFCAREYLPPPSTVLHSPAVPLILSHFAAIRHQSLRKSVQIVSSFNYNGDYLYVWF